MTNKMMATTNKMMAKTNKMDAMTDKIDAKIIIEQNLRTSRGQKHGE